MATERPQIDNENVFRAWLREYHHNKERLVQDTIARCRRINQDLGNIREAFDTDGCKKMLGLLTYTVEDAHNRRLPPGNLSFIGDKKSARYYDKTLCEGLRSLLNALNLYCEFRNDGREKQVVAPCPSKLPEKSNARKVPKSEFETILKSYHQWLVDEADLTKGTADCYKTYVRKLRAEVDNVFGTGWFESLRVDSTEISSGKRKQCSAFIEYNVGNAPKNRKKSWKDWRSAFHRFEDFLDDVTDFWNVVLRNDWKTKNPKRVEVVSPVVGVSAPAYAEKVANDSNAVVATYDHRDLVRIFIGRLKTQSRYYPDLKLLFPTRLLTKIFRKGRQNVWIEWLKSDVENMRVLKSENGDFVRFSDVAGIVIRGDGKVDVMTRSGETFKLMTRTASASQKIVCEVTLRGLRDISIDHVTSLENVLKNNLSKLHGLRRLTELFTDFKQKCGIELDERAERTWVNDFFIQFKNALEKEDMRVSLIADLQQVLDLEYELMDTRENSKKGRGR